MIYLNIPERCLEKCLDEKGGEPMDKFAEFREHVPAAKVQAYFESAETGLIPDFVYDGVQKYQMHRYIKGGNSLWSYEEGIELDTLAMMERSKASIAKMLGGTAEEIAFGQNSSHMYTLFTCGLDFQPGDNIVLPEGGWISNRYAWQIRQKDGLELRFVQKKQGMLLPEDCFQLCDENTKAICVPFVDPATGFAIDAEQIGDYCRDHDIWFVVDGVQAIGVLPIDVKKMCIDFLVGNDYKWMMNYCGTGFAYISKRLQHALIQNSAGWMSDCARFDTMKDVLQLRDDAGRFELGYPTVSGIYAMGLVAEKYLQLGSDDVRDYIFSLIKYLEKEIAQCKDVQLLYSFPEKNQSSILFIVFEPTTKLTNEVLEMENIHASLKPYGTEGPQFMRIGIHYYNNIEDIDRLIQLIKTKG